MDIADIVVAHADWIRMKARQYTSDKRDADDLAGETICKCLSQGARFDFSRSFKPWAQTIMENLYITLYNRRRRVLFTHLEGKPHKPCSEHADHLAELDDILRIIRQCGKKSVNMESLLMYAQGYGYQEIAVKLGIPKGTAASRVCLGKRALKEMLDDIF